MIPCSECGKISNVIDSRLKEVKGLVYVRRRRSCPNGHRFTTREVRWEQDVQEVVESWRSGLEYATNLIHQVVGGMGHRDGNSLFSTKGNGQNGSSKTGEKASKSRKD